MSESFDFVIVGAGSHGLATAYYLAKNHGITDVAVLEQSYIGSGAAGIFEDLARQILAAVIDHMVGTRRSRNLGLRRRADGPSQLRHLLKQSEPRGYW